MNSALGALVILITIAVVAIAAREHVRYDLYNDLLDGFWEAPFNFCERSDLRSAQMLFRADEQTVYILVNDADGALVNRCVDYTLSPHWAENAFPASGDSDTAAFTIRFGESVDPLPREATLRIDMREGMLGLFRDDVVYMEMYKNNRTKPHAI